MAFFKKKVKFSNHRTVHFVKEVPTNPLGTKRTILRHGGGPNGDQLGFVPKGWEVDIHGQDEEFNPDRWLDGSMVSKLGWGILPINGGSRIDLGQHVFPFWDPEEDVDLRGYSSVMHMAAARQPLVESNGRTLDPWASSERK